MDTRRVEQRLRAALVARAEQIRPEDLIHLTHPATVRRPRRLPLALAVPATVVVVLAVTLGVWALAGRPPGRGPDAAATAPLSVTASPRTATVPGTTATATYPEFTVSGGTPLVADQIRELLTREVSGVVGAYRDRGGLRLVRITAAAITVWGRYLSVRLDTVDDFGGPHGNNTSTAVVADTRTGARATAGDLFTDVPAVDEAMRAALVRQAGLKDTTQVGRLTMRSGAGSGLSWYPAADGLHWVLDRCTFAPCALSQPEAVVPWPSLTALVKPTTGP